VSLVALYGRLFLLVWSVLGWSFHSYTCLSPTIGIITDIGIILTDIGTDIGTIFDELSKELFKELKRLLL
jgi:hypothetical protein